MTAAVLAFTTAAVVSGLVCPGLIRWLRSRAIVDDAAERSSHVGQIPRGGGIALAAGILVSLLVTRGRWVSVPGVLVVVQVASAFGLLGLTDDVRTLSARSRLAAQIGLAVATGIALAGSFVDANLLWVVIAGAWIVGFVNAFNFMDGINGISSATTIIIGSSLALASYRWDAGIELPALAIAGAALGFTPFNLTNRVFLGDIGSYMLGAGLSMLAAVGVANGIPVVAAATPFALYLADVTHTLARRAARGERLMEAHREHVYQRLANESRWGHRKTTAVVSAVTFSLVAIGHLGATAQPLYVALATTVSGLMVAFYLALPFIEQRRIRP